MNVFITLEKFLKKHKISGIFFIPDYGSASIFKNDLDKLAVLDHAQLERDVDKEKRIEEVSSRVRKDINKKGTKSKYREYIRWVEIE